MKHFCTNQTPSLTLAYAHMGISESENGNKSWPGQHELSLRQRPKVSRCLLCRASWYSESQHTAPHVSAKAQDSDKCYTWAQSKCLSMHSINFWDVPKPTPFESGSPSFLKCFHHVARTLQHKENKEMKKRCSSLLVFKELRGQCPGRNWDITDRAHSWLWLVRHENNALRHHTAALLLMHVPCKFLGTTQLVPSTPTLASNWWLASLWVRTRETMKKGTPRIPVAFLFDLTLLSTAQKEKLNKIFQKAERQQLETC